ncbi:MAG: class I SAM-dependent methyltransferase [Pikeienuella sp.]
MSGYFDHARAEILPHLPPQCGRVLELGCGAGATMALIREVRAVDWAGGVERDPEAAARAEGVFDQIWRADLEGLDVAAQISPGSLDLVLCLDVLEHLAWPWEVLSDLAPLLRPGGRLILSVPNIRNWKFLWRLLWRGDFRYRPAGLLDRTHLRFFTFETAAELAQTGGLQLCHAGSATHYGPRDMRRWLIALSAGRLEGLIAKQILVVAERPGPAVSAAEPGPT